MPAVPPEPGPKGEVGPSAPAQGGAELAEEPEPEGPDLPDLSSLNDAARALLDAALEVLESYGPQPGTPITGDGNGIPQISVDRRYISDACRAMKDDERIGAKMLLCLAAVDYPPAPPESGKLQIVYVLQSLEPERTLALKTEAPYEDPVVPSVTSVWRAADWYEREAHDLFGVSFEGHPDLAPLLLYDGFEGYPGRKEFPFYEYREF